MTSDPVSTKLVIQMMPPLWREFQVKLDADRLFADRKYADSIFDIASLSTSDRLRAFAQQLRARLRELAAGPPGAARSAAPHAMPNAVAPEESQPSKPQQLHRTPASDPGLDDKYLRSLR